MARGRAVALALSAAALLASAAGCGGGAGVESGATVSVYADSELCVGARAELAQHGGRAGDLRVRALCLDPVSPGGDAKLARVGANARRATEDSTAVAYIGSPDPTTAKFAHPILESADIGWTQSGSGKEAMRRVLTAIESADTGSLREAVRKSLEAS